MSWGDHGVGHGEEVVMVEVMVVVMVKIMVGSGVLVVVWSR